MAGYVRQQIRAKHLSRLAESRVRVAKRYQKMLTPTDNWLPHPPSEKQQQALDCDAFQLLYGGAAAGGKTDFVLMDALRFVHHPHYRALIFRRTYAELAAVGGLIERSQKWLFPILGQRAWNEKNSVWTFPSGAKIGFRHMQHEKDKFQIQSIEIHRAYLEECNQFTETQAKYVITRVRKNIDDPIPLAVRYTTNPGGYEWVRNYVKACLKNPEAQRKQGRVFIQAKLDDNPAVDKDAYRRSLDELDEVTRAQLLHGDWDVGLQGNFFRREDFKIVDSLPIMAERDGRLLRYWDLAATEPAKGKDPDYTVGVLGCIHGGNIYVMDARRFRKGPAEGDADIINTTHQDGRAVSVRIEEEPGSSGKRVTQSFEDRLRGYDFLGDRVTGKKIERWRPWAAAVQQGRVHLVKGSWNDEFLNEHIAAPIGSHDDQIDAAAGMFSHLAFDRMMGQAHTIERSSGGDYSGMI